MQILQFTASPGMRKWPPKITLHTSLAVTKRGWGGVVREGMKREAGVSVEEGEMRDEQRGGKEGASQKQKEKTVADL